MEPEQPPVETDERFPSGPWRGFFLQEPLPGRQWMDLTLSFRGGTMRGEGRDRVGEFVIVGRYDVRDGKCWWSKRYLGKHDVAYSGYNEGKGIWGVWEIGAPWHMRGGFHIWPVGMGVAGGDALAETAEMPALVGAAAGEPAGVEVE